MAVFKDLKMQSDFEAAMIGYDIYEPALNNQHIVLQIMHGMAEHKNRYAELANYLSEQGIVVVVSSHRGHLGSADKADYGYMGKDGINAAVEDGHKLAQLIKTKYPDCKYYLMGHSMGSLIVRLYFQKYADELSGLIVCGAVANNPIAGMGSILASMIKRLKGPRYKSKLLDRASFGSFNKRFKKEGNTGFEWLSENKANVNAYMQDEGCGFIFSAQSFYDLTSAIKKVYGNYPKPLKNAACPVLFISGQDDPCGDYGVGILEAKLHMITQGIKNVEIILYPKMRHEILNESNKMEVYKDILGFISN